MNARTLPVWILILLLCAGGSASAQRKSSKSRKAAAAQTAAPAAQSADEDELGDLDEPPAQEAAPAPEPEAPEAAPSEPASDAGDEVSSDSEAPLDAALEATEEVAAGPTVRATPFAGSGIGTRSMRRPVSGGSQSLDTSVFPAAEVGLRAQFWPNASFSLAFLLSYQTSLGLTVEERPLFALSNEIGARADHSEFSVAPVFKLGESSQAPRLAIPVGASLRNFWPEVTEYMTPRYSLFGPMARVELWFSLGERAQLRVGPEVHWLAYISSELKDDGVASHGFALGGEVRFAYQLSDHFALELNLRQSNAFASSVEGESSFSDVERFVTARVVGVM